MEGQETQKGWELIGTLQLLVCADDAIKLGNQLHHFNVKPQRDCLNQAETFYCCLLHADFLLDLLIKHEDGWYEYDSDENIRP